jgi:type IX secretion system PorP/SprF family membrane protein
MKKIVTFIAGLVIAGGILKAQQTPLYSQFMFNKFLVNPASAGAEGLTTFNLTSREQWLGVKDAPMTNSISAQTRLSGKSFINKIKFLRSKYNMTNRSGNVGIGAHLYNDTRGLLSQTGLQLTYSTHFNLDEKQLSFGLTSSFTQFSINKRKLVLEEADDNLINSSKLNMIIPDFNFGVYLTSPEWYAGFSANNLMQSSINFSNMGTDNFKYIRQYNVIGGYRFGINRDYAIEPSFMFKTTEQFNYQADIAARVYYNDLYWGGVSFRTGGAVSLMFGMKYDRFYFGYAYDYSFNGLQSQSIGSHEIMVTYKIGKRFFKHKWLERF